MQEREWGAGREERSVSPPPPLLENSHSRAQRTACLLERGLEDLNDETVACNYL